MEDTTKVDHQLRQQFLKLNKPAKYGTAGFRDLATNIPYISFRVGAFVTILNQTHSQLCLGVVMSASHNKICDNGLKITNFSGNVLQMFYQQQLEKFVNEQSLEKAVQNFKTYLTNQRKLHVTDSQVYILIGGDTRPSTRSLLDLVAKGVTSQKGKTIDFGLTTTPQLQYYVYLYNEVLYKNNPNKRVHQYAVQQIRKMFWENFCSYFERAAKYIGWKEVKQRSIDCANGVGGHVMPNFISHLTQYFKIQLFNNQDNQFLNDKCGADFIKTECKFPRKYQKREHNCFVSFDGDADRIVFYVQGDNNDLRLIDGDRQGTVFTKFFKRISTQLCNKLTKQKQSGKLNIDIPLHPSIGLVQSYYANYSSSAYLKKAYNMEPVYAATGVKHLHQKAQHYDIGIYFEANGHGTVIFNKKYLNTLQAQLAKRKQVQTSKQVQQNPDLKKQIAEIYDFLQFYIMCCKLANPSVGDAITNFLLFQIALQYLKFDYKDTLKLYTDLKSKTSKIAVKNKQSLRVTDIQDKVIEPQGLQNQIQSILHKHNGKKAFLRASGTQNVLRLHVQAETLQQVQEITKQVTELVRANKSLN